MNTIKQIAVIECGSPAKLFELSPVSKLQGYTVSKIFYKNGAPESGISRNHPEATVVHDQQAIIDDDAIEMVVVSSPSPDEMNIVGDMLKANKATQVV